MDVNREEKEDFSLLDEKKKMQIISELEEEIKNQKKIFLNNDYNNDIININKNLMKTSYENNDIKNDLSLNQTGNSEKELNDKETIPLFEKINDYIKNNNIPDNCNINNKKEDIMPFYFNNKEEIKIKKNDEFHSPCYRIEEITNNEKQENIDNIISNLNNNKNYELNNKNLKYLNKIKTKKDILFNKETKEDSINKVKKGIFRKNSYNIKSKLNNKKSFAEKDKISEKAKTLYIAKNDNQKNNKLNKKNNCIKKAKSSFKKNFSEKNIKTKISHILTQNKKSIEKFEKLKKEIKNKFKEDHPFVPSLYSHKEPKNQTKIENFLNLNKPRTNKTKGRNSSKTENERLIENNLIDKNNINLNKINPKELSNRLYKLHQQIQNKKEKLQKIFEEKQMNKCSFSPIINNYSKKIMKKNNNISFNERNDNYIKQKNENIIKIREEINKEIRDKYAYKMNEKSKVMLENLNNNNLITDFNLNEKNVFNRLYKNNYYINSNIELDKNDFNDIKPRNNIYEIEDFLERQKLFEDLKKEHLHTYKILNDSSNKETKKNDEELTFKPKINQISDLIARTNPERIGEDIDDKCKRLYDEAEKIKQKKEQLKTFYNAQYDFTPKINKLSEIIGNNINIKKHLSDNNINIMKIENDNEYTFKPKILINQKYDYIQSNYKYDDNISQKIKEELNNKNNKMNILKSEQLFNYIKECKFTPETNKQMSNLNIKNPVDNNFYQRGLKKYMEQMEKAKLAKKEKEDKEKKVFLTGENWSKRDSNLVFKPFNLSKNNNNKIERIKEEIKNEEMRECSFKPVTNESKNKNIIKKILKEK